MIRNTKQRLRHQHIFLHKSFWLNFDVDSLKTLFAQCIVLGSCKLCCVHIQEKACFSVVPIFRFSEIPRIKNGWIQSISIVEKWLRSIQTIESFLKWWNYSSLRIPIWIKFNFLRLWCAIVIYDADRLICQQINITKLIYFTIFREHSSLATKIIINCFNHWFFACLFELCCRLEFDLSFVAQIPLNILMIIPCKLVVIIWNDPKLSMLKQLFIPSMVSLKASDPRNYLFQIPTMNNC